MIAPLVDEIAAEYGDKLRTVGRCTTMASGMVCKQQHTWSRPPCHL
jgi:hypothetical protein